MRKFRESKVRKFLRKKNEKFLRKKDENVFEKERWWSFEEERWIIVFTGEKKVDVKVCFEFWVKTFTLKLKSEMWKFWGKCEILKKIFISKVLNVNVKCESVLLWDANVVCYICLSWGMNDVNVIVIDLWRDETSREHRLPKM